VVRKLYKLPNTYKLGIAEKMSKLWQRPGGQPPQIVGAQIKDVSLQSMYGPPKLAQ
jgi:hypothetical protein